MPRVVAIHQPNFLPWLGYFHKMSQANAFVLLDDVQFSKGSYGNRVKIKTRLKGPDWLTVPVSSSQRGKPQYNEIHIAYNEPWHQDHVNMLQDAYHQFEKAPYFDRYFRDLMALEQKRYANLAALNIPLIRYLKRQLQIPATLYVASDFGRDFGTSSERLVNICKRLDADVYLSGQGARAYNDEELFTSQGVRLVYQEFHHPTYPQLHGGAFEPGLSVIDLLFNCGPDSRSILTSAA